jgi:anion-transporting  ArsA/GET3 family ATPase
VSGKGGVGKTTVAAALALAGARAGLRVILAEVGSDEVAPRLFEAKPKPVGYAGRELAPGLRALRIDPYDALAEYLALQLGLRSLVDLVLGSRPFRQLMDAAPGWRELITLGKVWHLEQMRGDDGHPHCDLLVVDAPATGHGVRFLDAPRVVVSAVRAGPLRRHAAKVEALVEDPERTLLLPVSLAEELPVRETAELVERVRSEVGIAVDRVVVNALVAFTSEVDPDALEARLERVADVELPGIPSKQALAACVRHHAERARLGARYARELGERTGLPLVALPFLPQGIRDAGDLALLAAALLAEPKRISEARP